MLAYAANRPQAAVRRPSPKTLLLVIAAHVAVVALILMAKPELRQRIIHPQIIVNFIRPPVPPPPNVTKPHPIQQQTRPAVYTPPTRAPTQAPTEQPPTPITSVPNSSEPGPTLLPPQPPSNFNPPVRVPTSTPAQPLTPPSELKPPYPESKLLTGEEASLTLRLTVDETGRVIAVDSIGRADAVFLAAARHHLMAHWRYKPAMQGGRAVASTLVVTLRFELDG
jgi:periplasmic protein TonB